MKSNARAIPVLIILGMAILSACNKSDPASPAANQITPDQAKFHIGEHLTVSGVVTQVSISKKGNTFINFGGTYPNEVFAVTVFDSYSGNFPDLRSLTGKRVTVTGLIKLYRGKPEIVLSDPANLRQ